MLLTEIGASETQHYIQMLSSDPKNSFIRAIGIWVEDGEKTKTLEQDHPIARLSVIWDPPV